MTTGQASYQTVEKSGQKGGPHKQAARRFSQSLSHWGNSRDRYQGLVVIAGNAEQQKDVVHEASPFSLYWAPIWQPRDENVPVTKTLSEAESPHFFLKQGHKGQKGLQRRQGPRRS
jgi:hypothetical protein